MAVYKTHIILSANRKQNWNQLGLGGLFLFLVLIGFTWMFPCFDEALLFGLSFEVLHQKSAPCAVMQIYCSFNFRE